MQIPMNLIDINNETKHLEKLINTYFSHDSNTHELSTLIKNIDHFLDSKYGHLLVQGSYKSPLSDLVFDRLEAIREFFKDNRNDFFYDKEYLILRQTTFKNRAISAYADYDLILQDLKQNFKKDIKIFKTFSFKNIDSTYSYSGFNSGVATHPGIDILLEKNYTEARLERHNKTLENHILENLLTHLLEMRFMNNDLIFSQQLQSYSEQQKRNPTMGNLISDDETLLNAPYLKYLLEVYKDEDNLNSEKILKDYIRQKGVFQPESIPQKTPYKQKP